MSFSFARCLHSPALVCSPWEKLFGYLLLVQFSRVSIGAALKVGGTSCSSSLSLVRNGEASSSRGLIPSYFSPLLEEQTTGLSDGGAVRVSAFYVVYKCSQRFTVPESLSQPQRGLCNILTFFCRKPPCHKDLSQRPDSRIERWRDVARFEAPASAEADIFRAVQDKRWDNLSTSINLASAICAAHCCPVNMLKPSMDELGNFQSGLRLSPRS